jgi:hypothetical protein
LSVGLLARFVFSRLSKPNTGATTVLVDEFDASHLDCYAQFLRCDFTAAKFAIRRLEPRYRRLGNS